MLRKVHDGEMAEGAHRNRGVAWLDLAGPRDRGGHRSVDGGRARVARQRQHDGRPSSATRRLAAASRAVASDPYRGRGSNPYNRSRVDRWGSHVFARGEIEVGGTYGVGLRPWRSGDRALHGSQQQHPRVNRRSGGTRPNWLMCCHVFPPSPYRPLRDTKTSRRSPGEGKGGQGRACRRRRGQADRPRGRQGPGRRAGPPSRHE